MNKLDQKLFDFNQKCGLNMANINYEVDTSSVQSLWNDLENHLIVVVNKLLPNVPRNENVTVVSQKITTLIKKKINLQNPLLKHLKLT